MILNIDALIRTASEYGLFTYLNYSSQAEEEQIRNNDSV